MRIQAWINYRSSFSICTPSPEVRKIFFSSLFLQLIPPPKYDSQSMAITHLTGRGPRCLVHPTVNMFTLHHVHAWSTVFFLAVFYQLLLHSKFEPFNDETVVKHDSTASGSCNIKWKWMPELDVWWQMINQTSRIERSPNFVVILAVSVQPNPKSTVIRNPLVVLPPAQWTDVGAQTVPMVVHLHFLSQQQGIGVRLLVEFVFM